MEVGPVTVLVPQRIVLVDSSVYPNRLASGKGTGCQLKPVTRHPTSALARSRPAPIIITLSPAEGAAVSISRLGSPGSSTRRNIRKSGEPLA